MKHKRIVIFIVSATVLLSLFFIYRFYFTEPTAFPTDEEVAKQMNEIFPEANVKTIQDTIKLDDKHIFVPFRSKDNHYGTGYWVWENNKWKPAYISKKGEPLVWKPDQGNPSSYHIVWNLHPDDQISNVDFYLIRDRNYQILFNEHTYIPPIQMKESVNLEGKSFGVMQFPASWHSFINQENKRVAAEDPSDDFGFFSNTSAYIGWQSFNDNNELTLMDKSVNGNSYTNGEIETDFVMFVEAFQLEK